MFETLWPFGFMSERQIAYDSEFSTLIACSRPPADQPPTS
jgi:hypothetical protein